MNQPITSIIIALLVAATCAFATEPFGNSSIWKDKQGKWEYPIMFTGSYLFIEHGTNWARLSLDEIFPGAEYEENVIMSTAGPLWCELAFCYILKHKDTDYLSMWCPSGKRVLLNLTDPKIADPKPLLKVIEKEEKQRVESFLAESAAIASEHNRGLRWDKAYAGMLLAIDYGLTNTVKSLRIFEEHSWQGPSCFHQGNYVKTFGLEKKLVSYKRYDGRRYAQLALRRLGYKPAGYRGNVFDKAKINEVIPTNDRKTASSKIKLGSTAREVYNVVGSPDYITSAVEDDDTKPYVHLKKKWNWAWRYDFDSPGEFSLLYIWDAEGQVKRIEKITPALWHGDKLFSDRMKKPAFWANGDMNSIHLYSPHFLGKIEAVEIEVRKSNKAIDSDKK